MGDIALLIATDERCGKVGERRRSWGSLAQPTRGAEFERTHRQPARLGSDDAPGPLLPPSGPLWLRCLSEQNHGEFTRPLGRNGTGLGSISAGCEARYEESSPLPGGSTKGPPPPSPASFQTLKLAINVFHHFSSISFTHHFHLASLFLRGSRLSQAEASDHPLLCLCRLSWPTSASERPSSRN